MALPALSAAAGADLRIWSHPRVAGLFPVFFPGIPVVTGRRVDPSNGGRLLLMTGSFRSALQGLLSGFRDRIGYSTDMRGLFLTRAPDPPSGRDHHHSEDYLKLVSEAGLNCEPHVPPPSVEPSGRPHVAFFPGARFGPAKRWPGFGPLAGELASRTGLPVVLYGSHEEEDEMRRMSGGSGDPEVMAGLPLAELVSRLLSAVLAVGNDSGGVHLSAAAGVPTVTVFGSTSPVWTAPLGPRTAIVASSVECSPCFRRSCPRGDAVCLSGIPWELVAERAMVLLDEGYGKVAEKGAR
ncbi:MAG: hypothetical protein AVO35_03965 [Candidatus Aegiribacteria sp. MLS_C]|nr:MAG: hypothetical protein AVO35_03965 [Candidatus Aegiribacteria sp. MLS_C]